MTTFFQQTAQAMIAKHIDRFPLLKLDQVIDWQPIEQSLNRQKTRYLRDHRGRPAYPLLSMFKAVLIGHPIPNSKTASSPASISTCFVVSKAGLFGTIFQRVFISIKIRCADKGCATDDIAQEYGNHVEEKLPPSDVCTCQNTRWDNEHIGDKVLEAV